MSLLTLFPISVGDRSIGSVIPRNINGELEYIFSENGNRYALTT